MTPEIKVAADAVCKETAADVFFLSGEITREKSRVIEKKLVGRKRRPDAFFVLVTQGGDPDAAYRIARAFQTYYKKVACFIPGWCKSAGTLITLAASTLYVGDLGELGPLDIQIPKQDELDEAASGLLIDSTMRTLETTASRMFLNMLRSIRRDTGVTTKMAAELSSRMVVGLMAPIFSQVEPMRIGENARAMNITRAYGTRLNGLSKSLQDPLALDILISAYPDHGFVIDRKEARSIYKDVQEPSPTMIVLAEKLGSRAAYPPFGRGQGDADYLSTEYTVARKAAKSGVQADVQVPNKGAGERSGRGARRARSVGAGAKGSPRRANGDARAR